MKTPHMKKPLSLLFIACLSVLGCLAQKNGTLSLSLGPAIPVGEFANKSVVDDKSGLAKIGWLADLSYLHPIGNKHFGFIATLRGRINGVDTKSAMDLYATSYPQYAWSATSNHWKAAAVMAGGYYNFPASSKIDIPVALLAGVAKAYFNEQTITGVRDSANVPVDLIQAKFNKVDATAFSGMLKAGMVYHLTKRCALTANIDFWYLKPTFKNVTQTVVFAQGLIVPGVLSPSNATSISVYSDTRSYQQPMNSVNVTVGLAYGL